MKRRFSPRQALALALISIAVTASPARADEYRDTIDVFKTSIHGANFFDTAYGYAVFPAVGKGGVGLGGAYGTGRVYERGRYIGDVSVTQLTIGVQAGGESFSQIVFFQDESALQAFIQGRYTFDAEASGVAVTAAAQARTGTAGSAAEVSAGLHDALAAGRYKNGMATFAVVKGGLMTTAALGVETFSFTPR
jgi:lipid-binding SYLF domain-containing protein